MNIIFIIFCIIVVVTLVALFVFVNFLIEKNFYKAIWSFLAFLLGAVLTNWFLGPALSAARETFIGIFVAEENTESITEEENTEKSTEENISELTTEESASESTTEENTVSEKGIEDEASETEEVSTEDEFVFPDSDTRRLLRSELEGKNEWECKIARNEIFARKGKIFDDPELQAYFESCSWYEGKNSQYEYSEYISEIEAYNVQLIREYEEEHGFNLELNVPE